MDNIKKIKDDIKYLYIMNIFIIVCFFLISIVEVPNFRDMVDRQLSKLEDYEYTTRKINLMRGEIDKLREHIYKSKIISIYEGVNQF